MKYSVMIEDNDQHKWLHLRARSAESAHSKASAIACAHGMAYGTATVYPGEHHTNIGAKPKLIKEVFRSWE